MSWRQDKQKRIMLSLVGGGLLAGLPLLLIKILALSEGRWWRPYAEVLGEFAFWPMSTIEPLADALYPDKRYIYPPGDFYTEYTETTLIGFEAMLALSLVTSIVVYATAVYALLSQLAERTEA